jgi:hypothetical protein
MDGFFYPIDFSGIVGYPHDISEDVIDNIPDFYDHDHAGAHIWDFYDHDHAGAHNPCNCESSVISKSNLHPDLARTN